MRKLSTIVVLCLMLCLSARAETSRVILYTAYEQQGWGDRVQAVFIDEDGGVWEVSGFAANMRWPSSPEAQAKYLSEEASAEPMGALIHDDLFALESLIAAVEDQGRGQRPGLYCDFGTSCSYAVRYDAGGEPSCVLLGAYGDHAFANTDPNAQALYASLLRLSSPEASDEDIMSAVGLQPVALSDFCGYDPASLNDAELTALFMGCEGGPIPVDLSEEEAQRIRRLAQYGSVAIKANAIDVTGGYTAYRFSDRDDNTIADIALYGGLLYWSDGMYRLMEGTQDRHAEQYGISAAPFPYGHCKWWVSVCAVTLFEGSLIRREAAADRF